MFPKIMIKNNYAKYPVEKENAKDIFLEFFFIIKIFKRYGCTLSGG